MGKVVVLGGNARSGKSTLSYMLYKKGFMIISFDILQSSIEESLNIKFDNLDEETKFNFFENIVNEYIKESEINNVDVVIDMYDFLPKDTAKLENRKKIDVYFLAYPNQTKEEIKHNVVHYAQPTDWIAQVNEKYLDSCVDRFYDRNEMLVSECKKYNEKLIDTKSGDERNVVLVELRDHILHERALNR